VHPNTLLRSVCILTLVLLLSFLRPTGPAIASSPLAPAAQTGQVTAYDLIIAMNTLRTSNGLAALTEDPIIDSVAQATADTMAANQMSSHIGNVSGRLSSAGYGGGATVWGTENFAVGTSYTIDQIMLVWSDDMHMIPALNPAYCNVGAGLSKSSNGMTYYVLQAAYTSNKACGEYKSPVKSGATVQPGGTTDEGRVPGVSQLIVAVKVATPDADGKIYHVVQAGQSFWSIAIAYKITIKDLETWNNLSRDAKLQPGQKLFIPDKNTAGYATPTPVGMIQTSTPDADGKIVHGVQAYQTLSSIAQAYGVKVETILALNNIQIDWPLQINQKLIISPSKVTPSPTPRPLTPIEKLTPAADGKYYHVVKNGETLSWIAKYYNISLNELMAWNNLDGSSILQVDQKLLLQVTPPATITPTPGPATDTPTSTSIPPSTTPSLASSEGFSTPTQEPAAAQETNPRVYWLAFIGAGIVILTGVLYFSRKRR
jgi:LysM repeat protein